LTDPTAVFEANRPALVGLAYRLLGSIWDAEDVVQDAYLRWMREDRTDVRDAKGFLIRVVSRLALDHLRSARVRRESYTGPWLPEPVATEVLGPLDTVELRDSVSFATVHLLERLTPPERAVIVLRDAFGLEYDDIAEVVDRSPSACRQLHHRALERLPEGRTRFDADRRKHERLLESFLAAASTGDLDALTRLLHDDVTAWSDGGGRARAALRPIIGRSKVAAFLVALATRYPPDEVSLVDVNALPGLLLSVGDAGIYVGIRVADDRITDLYAVLNPDKLGRVRSAAAS
jgi:RNA polymerase sigma-70 factor (ECF subfamily)